MIWARKILQNVVVVVVVVAVFVVDIVAGRCLKKVRHHIRTINQMEKILEAKIETAFWLSLNRSNFQSFFWHSSFNRRKSITSTFLLQSQSYKSIKSKIFEILHCSVSRFYSWPKTNVQVQTALVIRQLFICEFAYSHLQKGSKITISSQNWTFYLRIQDSRSRMAAPIYRE